MLLKLYGLFLKFSINDVGIPVNSNDCTMAAKNYVFSQITSFLDRSRFNNIVRKYGGDKYVKHFSSWNQLLVMMFGQLSNRESLRDLTNAVSVHHKKSYHLAYGNNVSKTNLAYANCNRDYCIFEEYAYFLWNKHVQNVRPIFSNLVVMYMPLIQQQLTYA